MTSAESTLLGIVIGAALAWLGNVLNSRSQWRREEHRRRRERYAELYQDMHMRMSRLRRLQLLHGLAEPPPDPTPQEIIEHDRWLARVELFASPEVSKLWDTWFEIHMEGWEIRRTATSPAVHERLEEQIARRDEARDILFEQMRAELEGKASWTRQMMTRFGRSR